MFFLKNYRTNEKFKMNSDEFKNFIINITNSRYENSDVTRERTGLRFSILDRVTKLLSNKTQVLKNIYLVSALSRINNNKSSRYLILIDNIEYDDSILELINDYIPVYLVKTEKYTSSNASFLSSWFRNNMGRGFSFVDIDYFITNNRKIVLLEEKATPNSNLGYGQLISYKELILDVLSLEAILIIANIIDDEFIRINKYIEENGRIVSVEEETLSNKDLAENIIDILNE